MERLDVVPLTYGPTTACTLCKHREGQRKGAREGRMKEGPFSASPIWGWRMGRGFAGWFSDLPLRLARFDKNWPQVFGMGITRLGATAMSQVGLGCLTGEWSRGMRALQPIARS